MGKSNRITGPKRLKKAAKKIKKGLSEAADRGIDKRDVKYVCKTCKKKQRF